MTEQEMQQLYAWLGAIKENCPTQAMALVVYVRDGRVHFDGGALKDFPTTDIPIARKHITSYLDAIFARDNPGEVEEP